MTNEAIILAAAKLGIKPTRAPVDSEVFECWRDRVYLALNLGGVIERESHSVRGYTHEAIEKAQREAIRWANAYAV